MKPTLCTIFLCLSVFTYGQGIVTPELTVEPTEQDNIELHNKVVTYGELQSQGFTSVPEDDAVLTLSPQGQIYITGSHHVIDTWNGAANDELVNIGWAAGIQPVNGAVLFLRSKHYERDIIIKHGPGNIRSNWMRDESMNLSEVVFMFIYLQDHNRWILLNPR